MLNNWSVRKEEELGDPSIRTTSVVIQKQLNGPNRKGSSVALAFDKKAPCSPTQNQPHQVDSRLGPLKSRNLRAKLESLGQWG